MSNLSRMTTAAILLLSGLIYGQQNSTAPLAITISGPTEPVKAGKDVYITVQMKNNSDAPLDCSSFYVNGTDRRFRVEVTRDDGKSMKLVDKHPEQMPGSFQLENLPPGESTVPTQMLISQFNDLTQPGKYEVQLSRVIARDEKNGLATSNKITITIAP